MKVKVQFFAQLRDAAGTAELLIDLPPQSTVAALLEQLYAVKPRLRQHDENILVGAGLEFVRRDYIIQPEDEIAVMPPVQGG